MRTRLLSQLAQAPNLDYVEHFQVLSAVNLEIRRHGPSAERLLRKAILEMDVGNYGASLASALDAVALDPTSPETHHQVGTAYLLLALAKAGAIPVGPGLAGGLHAAADESATGLLQRSIGSFQQVLRLNPSDQETFEDLAVLEQLHRDGPTDGKLASVLRAALN